MTTQMDAHISSDAVTTAVPPDMRAEFYVRLPGLLTTHPRAVALFAEIGVGYLDHAAIAPVADRVLNVGIREQLLIGAAGGLASAGFRPVVHTFSPFLVERPFEQVKLDLGHQGSGAVLVSAGGSYDWPAGGETLSGTATSRCSTPWRAGPCTCRDTPRRRTPSWTLRWPARDGSTCAWARRPMPVRWPARAPVAR